MGLHLAEAAEGAGVAREVGEYLLGGFAESCSNLILGGGIAVITWILVALGVRRMPKDRWADYP